jgi:hypothetical protein
MRKLPNEDLQWRIMIQLDKRNEGQKKRRIRFGGHAYPEKRKKKVETSDASRQHAYFSDQESSESD